MTRVFEKETFAGPNTDRDSRAIFQDLVFRSCSFEGCTLSITRDPSLRSTVRDVQLLGCQQRGSNVGPAIVEDVLVEGLKTHGLFQSWGAVFKHVTLRGRIGRLMLSPAVSGGLATPEQQRLFDEANASYYSSVDWALDVREAEFEECELHGVPGHLVRRDPETQFLVRREKAMSGEWRGLALAKTTHWDILLDKMLRRGDPDVVLVAPKRNRKFSQLLDGLKKLRDAGVAEPD